MKKRKVLLTISFVSLLLASAGFILYQPAPKNIDKGLSSKPDLDENLPVIPQAGQTDSIDIENALDQSIEMAIDDYEYKMRFPSYSVPIDNFDWNILNPRVFEVKPKAVFNEDGFVPELKDVQISLELEKFIVNVEHDLPLTVRVVSEQENSMLSLDLVNIKLASSNSPYTSGDSEKIHFPRTWHSGDSSLSGTSEFSGIIPSRLLKAFGESNVHVVAELIFSNGIQAMSGAAIKLFESTANLQQVGDSYLDGPHLMIPIDMLAQTHGYFRVQANLFDETGELAIAHLNEEIMTEQVGLVSGAFKVHIATLKEQGNQGPYLLKNIHINKIPTKPDYKPRYGSYDNAAYAVGGFDFAQYKDEEYVNPEMVRRLAALKKIAGLH